MTFKLVTENSGLDGWDDPPFVLTPHQEAAVSRLEASLRSRGAESVLRGWAGTGKSTCCADLARRLRKRGLGVLATAPTNKATRVLSDKMSGACEVRTTYSALGLKPVVDTKTGDMKFVPDRSSDGRADLSDVDVLVVDEASMVGRDLVGYVREAAQDYNFSVLWVGDPAQLPPVGERESIALLSDGEDLTEVMRHAGPILQYANEVREGRTRAPDDAYDDPEVWIRDAAELFKSEAFRADSDHARILCWTNEAVRQSCRRVHSALYGPDADPWQPDQVVVADKPVWFAGTIVLPTSWEARVVGKPELREDDGVLCWRVQLDAGLTVSVVSRAGGPTYRERLDILRQAALDEDVHWKRVKAWQTFYRFDNQFAKVDPVYASTVHRAQGSSYQHAFIHRQDVYKNRDREEAQRCYYTAVTRAVESLRVLG